MKNFLIEKNAPDDFYVTPTIMSLFEEKNNVIFCKRENLLTASSVWCLLYILILKLIKLDSKRMWKGREFKSTTRVTLYEVESRPGLFL